MKRPTLALLLPLIVTMFVAPGCGKSPTAPDVQAPAPTPMTPITATITHIDVTKFPATTPDGSNWDFSLIASARRPDLYVILTPLSGASDFVSTTASDAESTKDYAFTRAASGGLPATIPYGTSRRIYVMDEDFGGDDDRIGWITVNLPAAYQKDNARNFDHTFTDSGNRLSVRVRGTWSY